MDLLVNKKSKKLLENRKYRVYYTINIAIIGSVSGKSL